MENSRFLRTLAGFTGSVCVQARQLVANSTLTQSRTLPHSSLRVGLPLSAVCLCVSFNESSSMTILCQSCASVPDCCFYCYCTCKINLQSVHVCACMKFLLYLLSAHTHPASISALLCVSSCGMCVL